jgi:hypothetical protein
MRRLRSLLKHSKETSGSDRMRSSITPENSSRRHRDISMKGEKLEHCVQKEYLVTAKLITTINLTQLCGDIKSRVVDAKLMNCLSFMKQRAGRQRPVFKAEPGKVRTARHIKIFAEPCIGKAKVRAS